MKCCGNCEWSISPRIEEEILKEQRYDEDDINRPKAGDCCLSIDHKGEYVCDEHSYIRDSLTWIIYDEMHHEKCYYLTAEYDEEEIHTIKITMKNIINYTESQIEFPVNSKYSSSKLNSLLKHISSIIKNNEILFDNTGIKQMKRILKI